MCTAEVSKKLKISNKLIFKWYRLSFIIQRFCKLVAWNVTSVVWQIALFDRSFWFPNEQHSDINHLKSHIQNKHNTKSQIWKFKCPECHKLYSYKNNWTVHMKKKHRKTNRAILDIKKKTFRWCPCVSSLDRQK